MTPPTRTRRKGSLVTRIIVPTALALLLLPPLSCLIFQQAAQQFAFSQATASLEELESAILEVMDRTFAEGSESTPDEQVANFLREAGPLSLLRGEGARMFVLGPNYELVYPRDETERERAAMVLSDFASHIDAEGPTAAGETDLVTVDDRSYLVNVAEIPLENERIKYVVTFSSTTRVVTWVDDAALIVLATSFALAAIALIVLCLAVRSVTRPLRRLCDDARTIGEGSYARLATPFGFRELEALRAALNEMVARLERSDRAQRDFFQSVSHELRNPLMSISGYAQGIEQGVLPDHRQAARTILEESTRLTRSVESLLTLSRLEAATKQPELGPIALADVLGDSIDRVYGRALQKGVDITASAPSDVLVEGEEELLAKVLDNLLSNAVRYARDEVSVDVEAQERTVTLRVADDGRGIAPDELPHLFERGFKGADGEFGLGLPIARMAAHRMGGELTAGNRPEGGAVFTVQLRRR